MRRVLLAAAVVLPVVVLAVVSAGEGQVVEIDNYNATTTSSYLNAAQCAGTAPLRLEWNTTVPSGSSVTGTYLIFASNTSPASNTSFPNYCLEQDDPNASPPVRAGQVTSVAVAGETQRLDVTGATIATIATKAGATCDAASEGKVVWVCSHLNASKNGYASGKFTVQVGAPNAPTGVTVGVGDTRLIVRWEPSSGGAAPADRYYAEATPTLGGAPVSSSTTNGREVTISGLTNEEQYSVVVYALSVGGNRSGASDAKLATPMPVDDFWDTYGKQPGAREQGGCGTGGAGPFALLAVAGLLAALRRRK